jgi:hypothetical protein
VQPAWPLFQPQVAVVIQISRRSQEALHSCHTYVADTACHTQACNPLDMTKRFFTVVRSVLFHLTTSVLIPKCISTFGFRPHVFLLAYGIASKLYWPSVLCYRYETSNSVVPDSVSVACQRVLGQKPTKLFFSVLTLSPISPHQFFTQFILLCI